MGTENPITDSNGAEVPEGTLGAGQVPQGGTLPESQTDVEKRILEVSKKAEQDLNAMKSSFQKTQHELELKLEKQKTDYETYLRDVKLSSMDADARKKFEDQELVEKNKNYEEKARLAEQALAEREQKEQYRDFFLSVGIPLGELDITKNLTDFVNLGYAAWKKKTADLEAKLAKLEKQAKGEDGEITAPDVDTEKGKPGNKPGWPALIKKYGSAERVYRLVELGELKPSIIPPE